jgi:hypothetical protein
MIITTWLLTTEASILARASGIIVVEGPQLLKLATVDAARTQRLESTCSPWAWLARELR